MAMTTKRSRDTTNLIERCNVDRRISRQTEVMFARTYKYKKKSRFKVKKIIAEKKNNAVKDRDM